MGVFVLNKEKYFAAINTGAGFAGYFDRIFDASALNELYVIKSGPGTGKSSMMKRIAEAAENANHKVVYFYCSSDPYSLDGILIPSLSFGVLDGTSPHMTDPKYPKAADTVLDFYPYIDEKTVRARRDEVIALTDKNRTLHKKSSSYRRYAALAAREAFYALRECIDIEKLQAAVKRTADAIKAGKGRAEHRQISAFSTKGKVTLKTFENTAKTKIGICDEHGCAYLFLNGLKNALIKKHVLFYYSLDTLLPERCEAIFIPSSGEYYRMTGTMANTDRRDYDKLINMKRFIKTDVLKDIRGRLRMCEKIRDTLDSEALRLIAEAGRVHDRLEALYNNAVDFDGVRAATDRMIELRIAICEALDCQPGDILEYAPDDEKPAENIS